MDPRLEQKLAELAHAVEEFIADGYVDEALRVPLQSRETLSRIVEHPVVSNWLDKKRQTGEVPLARLPIRP